MKRTITKIRSYSFFSTIVFECVTFTGLNLEDAIKNYIRYISKEEDLNFDLGLLDEEFVLLVDGDIAKIYMFDHEYFAEKDLDEIEDMVKNSTKERPLNINILNPDFFTFTREYL